MKVVKVLTSQPAGASASVAGLGGVGVTPARRRNMRLCEGQRLHHQLFRLAMPLPPLPLAVHIKILADNNWGEAGTDSSISICEFWPRLKSGLGPALITRVYLAYSSRCFLFFSSGRVFVCSVRCGQPVHAARDRWRCYGVPLLLMQGEPNFKFRL